MMRCLHTFGIAKKKGRVDPMVWITADELTEDSVVLETLSELDPPLILPLPILNIVKEDSVVNVLFQNGSMFSYDASEQVEVREG